MHKAIEVLEESAFVSETHLLGIDALDAKKAIRVYETLYAAVHQEQNRIAVPEPTTVDPFTFLASASMRAESTCWEWFCRLEKLDFLARYAALYANRITVPLPLRRPDTVKDIKWAKSLLSHAGLTLLHLRQLIDHRLVVPVVMITHHCEHIQPWVDKMIRLTHDVADDAAKHLADDFRTTYQLPDKSPTGRSTIYVKGPKDFLEHGEMVQLFDEGPRWRSKEWTFNRVGKHELSGRRKIGVIQTILDQIATDTTFYLTYGRMHNARYLTDRRGEAFLLELLTRDEELAASNAALNAYMKHSLPLLGDLSLAAFVGRSEIRLFGTAPRSREFVRMWQHNKSESESKKYVRFSSGRLNRNSCR
jgi:hypothetical protein